MSHQFKPGDLALIINARFKPSIGMCVELVSYHVVPHNRDNPADPYAYEDPNGEPAWIVTGSENVPEGAVCLEKNLMPLRGDFDFAKEREQEVVHG